MGKTTNEAKKPNGLASWWAGVKAQFKRIIWPSKEEAARESGVVIAVTLIMGAMIAVLDRVLLQLVDLIISI